MDATPPPAIEAVGLGRRNPKADGWLIRDVSLTLNPGDRLGVLGPSGAGKTVLLRALARLDPLDSGSIRWRGRVVAGEAVPSYRARVIYLHQRPALLDGSVADNLRLPFALEAHRGRRFDPDRVVDLLGRLGRDRAFLEKASRDLSGGEAQIVGLLRALQLDPAALLLDEPTASLDPGTARAVEGLLDGWLTAQPDGRALVWVSHDRDQAHRMTSRRLFLRAGRLEHEEGD
jgi:putative ABC transport system ATP-binding protein